MQWLPMSQAMPLTGWWSLVRSIHMAESPYHSARSTLLVIGSHIRCFCDKSLKIWYGRYRALSLLSYPIFPDTFIHHIWWHKFLHAVYNGVVYSLKISLLRLSQFKYFLIRQKIQESDSQHAEFIFFAMNVITNNDNLTEVVIDWQ